MGRPHLAQLSVTKLHQFACAFLLVCRNIAGPTALAVKLGFAWLLLSACALARLPLHCCGSSQFLHSSARAVGLGLGLSRLYTLAVCVLLLPVAAADALGNVTLGVNHACVILPPLGGVRCWGAGSDGQLGYGDTTPRSLPPQQSIYSSAGMLQISAHEVHTCAVMDETFGVKCWGGAWPFTRLAPLSPSKIL